MSEAPMRIIVIGGGASGYMAAISAKQHRPQAEVLLLEKSDKWLAKVRISGGGRCNVAHHCMEPRKLARHYPRGEAFVRKVFTAWGQPQAVAWFEEHGVELKVEADGRMFPITDDSRTVIDALQGAVRSLGVVARLQCPVTQLARTTAGWSFTTSAGVHHADRVVVATGGSPKDEGLSWLRALGHEVVPAVPSLFTFNLPNDPVRELMGVVAPHVRLRIAGSRLESTGPLLITHWGLSGPAVLRLSAFGARVLHDMRYEYTVQVDWLGEVGEGPVREQLMREAEEHPKRQIVNAGSFALPARLWAYLLLRAGIPLEKPLGELGKKGMDRLLDVLTNDGYAAKGKTTFKEEFVTAGGIALHQVDPATLESRVTPGLFFAGEVLDIDGITGGFNFQAAWSTGWLAGRAAAQGPSFGRPILTRVLSAGFFSGEEQTVGRAILAPAMTTTQFLIDTPLATVERTAPHLVEVRFKPGSVLTVAGISAILSAREELGRSGPHQALIVFPAEETDFDMSMITADHYKGRPVEEFTSAAVWVTRNDHNERFVRLYFAYFPSPLPSAIFLEEEEARSWLQGLG